jgi:hypothetical protein
MKTSAVSLRNWRSGRKAIKYLRKEDRDLREDDNDGNEKSMPAFEIPDNAEETMQRQCLANKDDDFTFRHGRARVIVVFLLGALVYKNTAITC